MKIEMIGYNDTKAIGLYSIIKITPFVFSSFFISIIISIPAFIFKIYDLLFVFLLPLFLIFIMVMQYLINITNKNFLKDKRIKHKIVLEDGILYKDEKEIKSIANIRLYKFKKFLFLELKNSYYRIMNKDFIQGTRDDFLSQIKFYPRRHITFKLPPKSDEEITEIMFNKINLSNVEQLYYSKDKKHIIYIYKNEIGSFSIGNEKLFISHDEERYYSGKYGWWEPNYENSFTSYFGTIEEALNDIKNQINDFIKLK